MKKGSKKSNSKEFDEIQTKVLAQLKDIKIEELSGMDISRLLFNYSGEALQSNWLYSIKKFVRTLFFDTVMIKHNKKGDSCPLIVSYDYHRNDHNSYWSSFKNIVENYDEIVIDEIKPSFKRIRTVKSIVSICKNYYRIKHRIKKVGNTSFCRMTASSLAELVMVEESLCGLEIRNNAAFIFFDGGRIENLIVQHLRNKGITVATMQHGQPVFHGMDCDRINQTMILNFSSDYIMVTGDYSKKQFMLGGITENSIFVGGSLRKVYSHRDYSQNNFAVFLDCPTLPNAIKDNQELMECAEKLSRILETHYVIKCHPQDNPENYKNFNDIRGEFVPKGTSIREALKEKSFGLLHASGVYLDIISEGVKAFCYVNDTDFPLVEEGLDSFFSIKELEEKLKIWNSYEVERKSEYMSSIIEYYLYPYGVENRYKNFVDKINSNRKAGM